MANVIDEADLSVRAWPFYWLTRAMGRYTDAMSAALAGSGLDLPSWRVVMVLRETPALGVSDIADQANTKLAAMTKTIQRMKLDGLVETHEDPADRRVTIVRLTELGQRTADTAYQAAQRIYRRALHGLSHHQQAILSELLRDVAENLR